MKIPSTLIAQAILDYRKIKLQRPEAEKRARMIKLRTEFLKLEALQSRLTILKRKP